jgi:heptaprenyl diphosphate synthase
MIRKSTFSVTDIAILAAFCMFLSLIEYMIPKPMPFMRLGLAHLPVLLSLLIFPPGGTLLLTFLKVLGQGIVNGSLFSYIFLFSAAGSVASSLVMIAVYRLLKKRVSLVGVSVAGAMASNSIQILLARQFIFGEAAVLIAPPFLAVGIASSVLLGIFALHFKTKSEWIRRRLNGETSGISMHTGISTDAGFSRFAFICGLLCIPAFVFQKNTLLLAAGAAGFIIYSVLLGKKFRLLPNIIMAAGIIAANLLTPQGRLLAEIGRLKLTAGALENGAGKAALIIGLIYISRSSVRKGLNFPGRIGSLLSMVFYYFERFTEGERIGRKNIIKQLDNKLLDLSSPIESDLSDKKNPGSENIKAGTINYIAVLIPLILIWMLFTAGLVIG